MAISVLLSHLPLLWFSLFSYSKSYLHSILELKCLFFILHFQLKQHVKDKQSQQQIRFNSQWRRKVLKSFIEHVQFNKTFHSFILLPALYPLVSFTTPLNVTFAPALSVINLTVPICSGCTFSVASQTFLHLCSDCFTYVSSQLSWAKTVAPVKSSDWAHVGCEGFPQSSWADW